MHQHIPNLHELGDRKVDRNCPLTLIPIISGFRVYAEGSEGLGRLCKEGLQKCRVDAAATFVAGKTPDLIRKDPNGPTTGLFQHHERGARAPFLAAKQVIGR